MADFSALSKYKVTEDNTARYIFTGLPGAPWVECKPATKANSKYISIILKNPNTALANKQISNGIVPSEKVLNSASDSVIDAYAQAVIVKWGDFEEITPDKTTPPCNKANVKQFLTAISDTTEWDEFQAWAQNPRSFLAVDSEEKAKN